MISCDLLHGSETLRIQHFRNGARGNPHLAFVFSALGNKILNENLHGGQFLVENGFDVVSFSSIANDWFQTVPERIFGAIAELHDRGGYDRRVALGSSMGGYAAICFSALLRCDSVLAYSPQYSITGGFDARFEAIGRNLDWRYRISREAIAEDCDFYLVYDDKDHDRAHVASLRGLIPAKNLHEIVLPYAGHATVHYLFELGTLKSVTLAALSGNAIDLAASRKNRGTSRQYLATLAAHLSRANHPRLAQRVRRLIGVEYEPSTIAGWMLDRNLPLVSRLAARMEMRNLERAGFDTDFYRYVNFDVEVGGADPLEHYVRHGRREGRLARFERKESKRHDS